MPRRRAILNAFERSYRKYKMLHKEYKEKGYAVQEKYTKNQYRQEVYEPGKRKGSVKNAAINAVRDQLAYTYTAARKITKIYNELKKQELGESYKPIKVRELVGLNMDIQQEYVEYEIPILGKYVNGKREVIGYKKGMRLQTKKEAIYNYLRDMGVDTTEYYGY